MSDSQTAPSERLFSDEAIEGYQLRQVLERDADRAATMIWWGYCSVHDARVEFRGLACLAAARFGARIIDPAAWADRRLLDELERHGAEHERSIAMLRATALRAITAGGAREHVVAAVVEDLGNCVIPVPPRLMLQAVDEAAIEFRRAESWWTKRAAATTTMANPR